MEKFLEGFLQKPEIYHWAQVLIDYPLAFTCLGLAGVCKPLPLGILIGAFGRFVCHTISGFLFFSEVLDGAALWVSVVYNGWYMLFELVITEIVVMLIYQPLRKFMHGDDIIK